MIEPSLTRIAVRDLCLFAYHGVLPEENRLGQRFFINLDVLADIDQAITQDHYVQAVCYSELCRIATEVALGANFQLIETLADRIARALLEHYAQISEIRVEIRKPSAPLPYTVSDVAVEVTRKRDVPIALALGANIGDRESVLKAALETMARSEGMQIERVSSLYDSAPWGVENQPPFVNLCLLGRTTLSPFALLRLCKETELLLGRVPGRHWGERALDIDVLFYGQEEIRSSVLTVPHACIFERAFVLEPLYELAPDLVISGHGVRDALSALHRSKGDVVRRSQSSFWDLEDL